MTKKRSGKKDSTSVTRRGGTPYASNEVRLSAREWIVAGAVAAAVLGLLPAQWKRAEPFQPSTDYRIPYELSSDYWLYDRYSRIACSENRTLVIGDSVVWGHYVKKEHTLSQWLNVLAGDARFANLGQRHPPLQSVVAGLEGA